MVFSGVWALRGSAGGFQGKPKSRGLHPKAAQGATPPSQRRLARPGRDEMKEALLSNTGATCCTAEKFLDRRKWLYYSLTILALVGNPLSS